MSMRKDTTQEMHQYSANTNPIPAGLSDLVTQTDKDGNYIRTDMSADNKASDESPRAPSPLKRRPMAQKKAGFFARIFCCASVDAVADHGPPRNGNFYDSPNKNKETVMTNMSQTPSRSTSSAATSNYTPPPRCLVPRNERPLTPQQRQIPALLGPVREHHQGRLTLVLDLDETLVHSSFQPVQRSDFIIPVTIEGVMHNVFVIKRPGVDEFLLRASKLFEIIIYTASLSKYADPLLDKLDKNQVICSRLFREHCVFHQGHYVKDLSLLNRDVRRTVIVDNSPMSYIFHPAHAIDCLSFIDDPHDTDMWKIIDFLEAIHDTNDVRPHCTEWRKWVQCNPSSIPREYHALENLNYKDT